MIHIFIAIIMTTSYGPFWITETKNTIYNKHEFKTMPECLEFVASIKAKDKNFKMVYCIEAVK